VVETVRLPTGNWRFGPGGDVPDMAVASGEAGTDTLGWRTSGAPASAALKAGEVSLDLTNDGDARLRLYLTREGGFDAVVRASALTTRASFRRQLGHQVLATNSRVAVRSVALLFTDLSGSTAMYVQMGDAAAFAIVRDHFEILRRAAADSGGTVVKTIGDAVMAVFDEPVRAMECALRMQVDFDRYVEGLHLDHPLSLKVGLHVGSALCVHSDAAGLDYFGGTVNLAARAQGAAHGRETVWTQAVHEDTAVGALLRARGCRPIAFKTGLKGLGEVPLYRLSAGADDDPSEFAAR